jgi:hypothetical protein
MRGIVVTGAALLAAVTAGPARRMPTGAGKGAATPVALRMLGTHDH